MRSWLFVPGDSERKITKALTSAADVVILDLEDSVSPENKAAARELISQTLSNPPQTTSKIFVRVNPLDSGMTNLDLKSVLLENDQICLDGFMLPKTNNGTDVVRFAKMLPRALPIIVIATETATSLFNLGTYTDLDANLTAMTWGAEDLSNDLGATSARDETNALTDPYRLARSLCLAGARSAMVEPIDSVYTNFKDTDGLRMEAKAAVRDGFTGKMAIHPNQVDTINEIFTPSQAEIEAAKTLIAAFDKSDNQGVVAIDGQMFDIPHLKRAKKLITRSNDIT